MDRRSDSQSADLLRGPAAKFRPARALRSATWIAALCTLGLNDHLLKHAGLLPAPVTGKLSDIAGMFVAPALLATILRVRTLSGLRRCYLAVFAVFAAIKLSPAASTIWTSMLGAIGVPSVNVCDPTDVPFAFMAILLSWRALAPVIDGSMMATRGERPGRRVLESLALSTGVLLCVATQPRERMVMVPEPAPVFAPPSASPESVVVITQGAVSGYIELRCTDGTREELPFEIEEPWRRHSWAVFEGPQEGDAECKLKVYGAPGSYGPIVRGLRLGCSVNPGSAISCSEDDYKALLAAAQAS